MWRGAGTGFSLRIFRRFRLRLLTSESFRGVRRRLKFLLFAMALRERMATRLTTLNYSVQRRRRRLTAAILFFVPEMRTIARPVERGPARRWLVSMRMVSLLRAGSGGRKGYWELILMEASR